MHLRQPIFPSQYFLLSIIASCLAWVTAPGVLLVADIFCAKLQNGCSRRLTHTHHLPSSEHFSEKPATFYNSRKTDPPQSLRVIIKNFNFLQWPVGHLARWRGTSPGARDYLSSSHCLGWNIANGHISSSWPAPPGSSDPLTSLHTNEQIQTEIWQICEWGIAIFFYETCQAQVPRPTYKP